MGEVLLDDGSTLGVFALGEDAKVGGLYDEGDVGVQVGDVLEVARGEDGSALPAGFVLAADADEEGFGGEGGEGGFHRGEFKKEII